MRVVVKQISAKLFMFDELDALHQQLISAAAAARANVQAPYSRYHVGAAAQFADGRIFQGVNVENVSYTQTTHAEQTAIVSAVAAGVHVPLAAMAIVGAPGDKAISFPPELVPPFIRSIHDLSPSCGQCLQIMWEQCGGNRDVQLISLHPSGVVSVTTIGDAYPMAFGPVALGIDVFAREARRVAGGRPA